MRDNTLEQKKWWDYLEEDLQELLKESLLLLEVVASWNGEGRKTFHDYSFVIFPASKAYEGFLKKMFLDLGFITQEEYFGKHFRIGKALNPSLDKRLRENSVYNKLSQFCGGDKSLADTLWETWKKGRNLVFHWFPNEKNAISFPEASSRFEMIIRAFDKAFEECKIKPQAANEKN